MKRVKQVLQKAVEHRGFRRYFANTSWMFAEQVLRLAVGLFVGIWVARYLGPENFGVFSYAIAFAAIFAGTAKLGLDSILIRNLVRTPDQSDVLLGTAFWLKMIGAMAMLSIIAFAVYLTEGDAKIRLYILIIASGTIFQSFEVVDFYFQSKVLSKFVSLCKMAQLLCSSGLRLYLLAIRANLQWFVIVSLVDQALLALSFHLAYRYQRPAGFYHRFDKKVARGLLLDSWPLVFSGIAIMVYMRIDQIMVKQMLGNREVGLYSAAVRLSEMWYFIPVIITSSLFPAIVSAKKSSRQLYYSRLQRLYTFLMWLAVAIAIPMTFVSKQVVALLYGAAYREAGQALMIHIWAGVFVSLGVASSSWYTSENLQRLAFYRTFAGAVVNVLLNTILIPRLGIAGAAISTVVAQSMASLFFDLLTKETRVVFGMKLRTLYVARTFARNAGARMDLRDDY